MSNMGAARVGDNGALIMVAGAVALTWAVRNHLSTPYDPQFEAAAKKWGVPSNLLRAIGRHESGFRATAYNPASGDYPDGTRDIGLMQINSRLGSRYGFTREQLLLPANSVECAARYLSELKGNLGSKLSPFTWPAAYNVGPDLLPAERANVYASIVLYHWQLYDFGRVFA